MARSAALPLMVLALSALSIGCGDVPESEIDAYAIDEISQETMGGGLGTTGQNHLDSTTFHSNALNLYNSARDNFAVWNGLNFKWWLKNNTANNTLKGTTGGRSVLDYAARCGLPSTHSVWYMSGMFGVSVTGQGHMATTAGWKTAGLTMSQTADLFACVIAHMNGFGETVPIHLSGPNVNEVSDGPALGYTWDEALFAVDININWFNGGVDLDYHAYPFPHAGCPTIVTGIDSRICGSSPACGLTIHPSTEITTHCFEAPEGYYCDLDSTGTYVPMVKTRLKAADVSKLYRTCGDQ